MDDIWVQKRRKNVFWVVIGVCGALLTILILVQTFVINPRNCDNDGDGFTRAEGDWNDQDTSSYPGAPEICDGKDNDGLEGIPADEQDADHDGWMECDGDCDDTYSSAYPQAKHLCDGQDNDCDDVISPSEQSTDLCIYSSEKKP